MAERKRLDLRDRMEIANEVWRIFGLIAERVVFSFDEDGVTIRVPFTEPVDLDGPIVITGLSEGYQQYSEFPMGRNVRR